MALGRNPFAVLARLALEHFWRGCSRKKPFGGKFWSETRVECGWLICHWNWSTYTAFSLPECALSPRVLLSLCLTREEFFWVSLVRTEALCVHPYLRRKTPKPFTETWFSHGTYEREHTHKPQHTVVPFGLEASEELKASNGKSAHGSLTFLHAAFIVDCGWCLRQSLQTLSQTFWFIGMLGNIGTLSYAACVIYFHSQSHIEYFPLSRLPENR